MASPHVQVALQPHESKKLNLVAPEKSIDFSYAIKYEIKDSSEIVDENAKTIKVIKIGGLTEPENVDEK